ncbi:MAG: glycosyltransferase family 4 protein, partial [Candidatus Parvarchaeota archaeon]
DPDVIYVNSFNALPFVPLFGKRTMFGMHSIYNDTRYQNLRNRLIFRIKYVFLLAIVKVVWRKKNIAFHALTKNQGEWITKLTRGQFPVFVVENPVDISLPTPIETQIKRNDRFRILYFGSWAESKGFMDFLRVLDFVERSELRDFVDFVVAGGGELEELIRIRSSSFDNISIIESPSDEEKEYIMIHSDLLIYLSRMDSYGWTLVEAQLCGLPVIASDLYPFSDIIVEGVTGRMLSLKEPTQQIYNSIKYYFGIWSGDFEQYMRMRKEIINVSKRLSKENVLPRLVDMLINFISR